MLTRVLAVTTLVLALIAVVQYRSIARMSAELPLVQAQAAAQARQALVDSMQGQGAEVQRTLSWLNDYYKASDGLQRPDGLLLNGHPDFEGMSIWIFDVYLKHRFLGDSEDQARKVIVEAIRQSDEWRSKHR